MARRKNKDALKKCPQCGEPMQEYGIIHACPGCDYVEEDVELPEDEDGSELEDAT